MGFLHLELLLLGAPAAFVWWRTRSRDRVTNWVRAIIGLLLLLALSAPYLQTSSTGRDLVVVVDRSRSMPLDSEASVEEVIRLVEEERSDGDRVAVVSFGSESSIERVSSADQRFQKFERKVDANGTDIASALETALNMIPEQRQGSILLLSDGENNGQDPIPMARRAFGRDVRIDVRSYSRPDVADLSVERVDLPGQVAVGEPFQFNVWVRSDRRVESQFVLKRGDKTLSSGERVFEVGLNRLVFRDKLDHTGISEYHVELAEDGDRVPENNLGMGAVQATGAASLMVLNSDGRAGSLVTALRQAGIPTAVMTPESARLDAVGLTGFRGVILENVAADRLLDDMDALRDFVHERGGGLFVTGGQSSFGVGGYFLSPLDDLLPVSMEMRQEHRKIGIALAITLDRSGSMGAAVTAGQTKMDLANLGTSAAIELLSPRDSVTVIAVDSSYHIIQALTPVSDAHDITRKVRTITAGGGGIFTYTALLACVRQLESAPQATRHIILFADAADSEEQGKCRELVRDFVTKMNGSLSVIALGTEKDSDAQFLKDIAKIGEGECYFTMDPTDLPRLFAMDTMTASRSTFIEEPAAVDVLNDLFGMADLPSLKSLRVAGYNLTYIRPSAQAGMVTQDSNKAPIFAFMQQGLGRSAAYTGQIGGTFGADVVAWDGFSTFFVTIGRWLLGNEEPEEFFTSVRREGKDAILSVEIDTNAPIPPDTSMLVANLASPNGTKMEVVLERTGDNLFEARYPLSQEGVTIGTVKLGDDRIVTLPPIVLPYSPEFERSPDPDRGIRLLRNLARESGGQVGGTATTFFRGERAGRLWRVISRELMIAALLFLLMEIAGRRLGLWGSVGKLARRAGASTSAAVSRARAKVRRKPRVARVATPAAGDAADAADAADEKPVAPPEPVKKASLGSALNRARREADRKLDR
jgi:Mg-chelatase subunit ChlD